MVTREEKKQAVILENDLHMAFVIGIILKGINASIEVVLGILLLSTHVVANTIRLLLDNALIEDPDNFFATHLYHYADLSSQAQFFGGLYLLSHGAIKVLLVGGLFANKLWAYPAAMAVLSLFMVYQIVRFIETQSIPMLVLTIFDAVLVWLIWHEYQRVRPKRSAKV